MSSLPAGEIVATCDNVDESGILLFQVVRFDPKELSLRRNLRWSVKERRTSITRGRICPRIAPHFGLVVDWHATVAAVAGGNQGVMHDHFLLSTVETVGTVLPAEIPESETAAPKSLDFR